MSRQQRVGGNAIGRLDGVYLQQSFNRFPAEQVWVEESASCPDCLVDPGTRLFQNHKFKTEVEYFAWKHLSETLHEEGTLRLLLYVTVTGSAGQDWGVLSLIDPHSDGKM